MEDPRRCHSVRRCAAGCDRLRRAGPPAAEEPEGWLIAWSIADAALCLSLAVIAVGYLVGFGPVTFRVFQITGSMLAPLWLAVGVIQLLAEKVPARFVAWLLGIAFTIVAR